MDQNPQLAGLPVVPARDRRESRDIKALGLTGKRGNQVMICSGLGRRCSGLHEVVAREVRDLPWGTCQTAVIVELYRVRCPDCGPKIENVEQVPGKAYFSKRFEDALAGPPCRRSNWQPPAVSSGSTT